MDISPEHIEVRKVVGKIGKKKVFELRTTGGLNMIVKSGDGDKPCILGVGSHRAIARHIAKQKEPEIEWTELSKSDSLEYRDFAYLLPIYEELTEQFIKLSNG